VSVVPHGLLSGNSSLNGLVYSVNLGQIKLVKYGTRWMKVSSNVQENDKDGRKDQILSDFGLALLSEKAHGKLTGITG
jgi:hypothetical protein